MLKACAPVLGDPTVAILPIPDAFSDLSRVLVGLEESSDMLGNRLIPVLPPLCAEEGSCPDSPSPNSQVANEVRAATERIRRVNRRLVSLLDRLEL